MAPNAFLKWLAEGKDLVVAEGYLFEFERRGLLKTGAFVPEVVIDHPATVKSVSEEFVYAGSDVVVAYTYYGHREKLRLIGREEDLERMNRTALQIAKEVAQATGTLCAGDLSNTTTYRSNDKESHRQAELMFKEQIEWAVEAGVDYIIGETFSHLGEAMLALECVKKYGKGLPAVITIVAGRPDVTFDGVHLAEACRKLEEAGAAVVGLNCGRGPATMLPIMREIRKACKGPIACIPVPYRTSKTSPVFQSFLDPKTGKNDFPLDLSAHLCRRTEIREFAEECKKIGVQYIGLCCGNACNYLREVAEAYGRKPPASRYAPDVSQHYLSKTKINDPYVRQMVDHKGLKL